MDSVKQYSSKAELYARYRWDYAPEAIQTILDTAQISTGTTVADIGSGTGILTQHFVDKAVRILAVEPNAEMRQLAIRAMAQHPTFYSTCGCAENTAIPDQAVDLITVGQALNWFEPKATKELRLDQMKRNGIR
jgi:ubiquinone/menaquinone biosynthesis C-methylase UbiE